MPRTIQLHPLSLLGGVGFTLLSVVAMGQVPVAKRPVAAHDSGLLQVAHPRDWVVVEQGQPYTVPPGKLFVITALGSAADYQVHTQLDIDNSPVLTTHQFVGGQSSFATWDTPTMKPVPIGLRASPGQMIEPIQPGSNWGRAWGYLVDA